MDSALGTEEERSQLEPSVISYQSHTGKHQFRINRQEFSGSEYTFFNNLENILQEISSVATTTETERISNVFQNAEVYCKRLFQCLYETSSELPVLQDIYEGFIWTNDGLREQTITIEKSPEDIVITYETGFFADEETLSVKTTEGYTNKGCTVGCSIRQAAAGITAEHFPLDPTKTQEWRQTKSSKIQLSIQGSEEEVELGISNTPPEPPLWHRLQCFLSVNDCEPAAYSTFDLSNQTKSRKRWFYTGDE